MKKVLIVISVLFGLNQCVLGQTAQENHLSLIYDFDGNDFDYSVTAMVGVNDSLYIISTTPNGQGMLFRIDANGEGYEVIWDFDEINFAPNSLAADDTVIYGTTRFSANGGGTVFQYSLQDYSFSIVKDFEPTDAQEVQIKYLTDSVMWLSSQWSWVDEGSIFILNRDGTGFEKIYNDTNMENGQNPVDFVFHEEKIYIACFNGGGIPYTDGTGETVSSGSFIRINADGTGYENIVPGGDAVGTQPQSLIIQEGKLIGLFAYSGSNGFLGGQFFRSELDGSSYDSLGALDNRALTKLLSTDSLIYGISSSNVFGINPFDGEIRIFDDLESNPDFGVDVVANPAYLNDEVFLATQQGGPNGGGTILKWLNENPELSDSGNGRRNNSTSDIVLSSLFTDPEGDPLTFSYEYDEESVTLSESGGILSLTPLISSQVNVKITVTDGWAGYNTTTIVLNTEEVLGTSEEKLLGPALYPNPVDNTLIFRDSDLRFVEVIGLDGKVHFSSSNPKNEINVSTLDRGLYFIRINANGVFSRHKIYKR